MKICGCVALVTGGASGIGRGICEVLLQRDAKVAIVDVNEERGKEAQKMFEETYGAGCTKFIRCDVSVESELKEAFSTVLSLWGQLDIVCNNAAVVDEDNWNRTLNTNLSANRDKGIRVNCICPGRTDTEMDFPRHRLRKEEIEAQDSLPKQPVAAVTSGVVELIEDDSKVGEVLVVCVTKGTKYKQFNDN